jgi:hypothetical protein
MRAGIVALLVALSVWSFSGFGQAASGITFNHLNDAASCATMSGGVATWDGSTNTCTLNGGVSLNANWQVDPGVTLVIPNSIFLLIDAPFFLNNAGSLVNNGVIGLNCLGLTTGHFEGLPPTGSGNIAAADCFSVPEFPYGMTLLLAAAVPVLLVLKRRQ